VLVVNANPAATRTGSEQVISTPSEKHVTALIGLYNNWLYIELRSTIQGEPAA
jgi:hypothetical protein